MLDTTPARTLRLKSQKPLPKMLPGAVCQQWKRCGRHGCRCMTGALHGPYYYRFWREGGRLRKAYVKPADLDAVQAACVNERELRRARRVLLALGREDWQRLTRLLRERNHDD